jgi:hypothetical protein
MDNSYHMGENKQFNKSLRRKATNEYLLNNCPDYKEKWTSGIVKN